MAAADFFLVDRSTAKALTLPENRRMLEKTI
jgi:hypothetical protein